MNLNINFYIFFFFFSRRSTTGNNIPPHPVVHHTTKVSDETKDVRIYNTAYDSAGQQYDVHMSAPLGNEGVSLTLRGPAPPPRSQPNHIYDELDNIRGAGAAGRAEDFPHEQPPSYSSAISDLDDKLKEEEVDSGYLPMNQNVMYDTPRLGTEMKNMI